MASSLDQEVSQAARVAPKALPSPLAPPPLGEGKTSGWRLHLSVLAYFLGMTLALTYPLVLRMADSVVGEIGDNIYFVFLIRWYQKAWFELGISPFFHPWLNYPQGWNLASTDTSLATTLFGLPFSVFAGPTLGYNVAMLVTFVLSGWAMFFWVRRLTGSAAAGLVAGTIFAFLPYRFAHFLIGHMNLSGTQWFPLYFMGLYDLLRAPRDSRLNWKPIALTAVSLGLIGFTSMHYLYMVALISAVFVGAYLLLVDRGAIRDMRLWQRFAALGAAALLPVLAAMWPFLAFARQGGLASRSLSYVSMYSASPADFILPPTFHFLWGRWVGSNFDRSLWIEATLYIGVVALALTVLSWLRRTETGHKGLLVAGLVVIVVAFVLALGTDLHWMNQRVMVDVPGFLQSLLHREQIMIPLPSAALFLYLPFYAKMRALMRIGFFVLLFTSVFAGVGAGWLLNKVGSRRVPLVTVALLVLVLLDFAPRPFTQMARVEARPVDSWLAAQPGQGAVVQFPFVQNEDQDKVYDTLVHGKPYVGGFFSANQPEQYLRIKPVLENFPSAEGAMLLKDLKVQWLLFDTGEYPHLAEITTQLESFDIHYVTTVGNQAVFEMNNSQTTTGGSTP